MKVFLFRVICVIEHFLLQVDSNSTKKLDIKVFVILVRNVSLLQQLWVISKFTKNVNMKVTVIRVTNVSLKQQL